MTMKVEKSHIQSDSIKHQSHGESIEVKEFSFQYGAGNRILSGVNFSLASGQVLAVVGGSGSGKSTLLHVLAGLQKRSENVGTISIGGCSPDEFSKTGKLSYMFQSPSLFPHLTVEENLMVSTQGRQKTSDKVYEALVHVGLASDRRKMPHTLSGGMQTRVALACAMVSRPSVLLLDEPFSSLDVAWKSKLYNDLESHIRTYNTTTVLVTHDLVEVLRFADFVLCIGKGGRVLMYGPNQRTVEFCAKLKSLILTDLERSVVCA